MIEDEQFSLGIYGNFRKQRHASSEASMWEEEERVTSMGEHVRKKCEQRKCELLKSKTFANAYGANSKVEFEKNSNVRISR